MYDIYQVFRASVALAKEAGVAAENHQQIADWLCELQRYRNNAEYMSPAAEVEWNKMVTGLWVIFTMVMMLGAWMTTLALAM